MGGNNVKLKVICTIVLGIFFIVFAVIVYNSKIVGEMSSGLTVYKQNEKYYQNYGYRREGIVEPKINDIVLLDDNYKPIPNENDYFHYEFYINEDTKEGVSYEDYIFEGVLRYRKKVKGYRVENNELRVVLGIIFYKKMPEDYSSYIKISYSTLGIKRNCIMKIALIHTIQENN